MRRAAVVLYGPPASGKDSVTTALGSIDPRYTLVQKLKVGSGRHHGYRVTAACELAALRAVGRIVYESHRYGNTYAVDARALEGLLAFEAIPVVHMGQLAGLRAIRSYDASWLAVALWCPRRTTERRARARGGDDVSSRLVAWDETRSDFAAATGDDFVLTIDTAQTTPADAAQAIHAQLATMW